MIKGKVIKAKPAKSPRISINKLAEYSGAKSSRRKKIVEDAKYPEQFVTTRYKDAREAAIGFLTEKFDKNDINKKVAALKKAASALPVIEANKFKISDGNKSAAALLSLLGFVLPKLDKFEVSEFNGPRRLILINGVSVSVNPDIILKKTVAGIAHYGAIKLHISDGNQLTEEGQKIVAVYLREYVERYTIDKKKGEISDAKMCYSIDLFKQSFEECPASTAMRIKNIEDCCEEIALWWDKL